jgi:hypothetical protein
MPGEAQYISSSPTSHRYGAPPAAPLKHFRRSDILHPVSHVVAHEKYRGIRYRPELGRYISEIRPAQPRKRKIWLGTYKTAEEAARAFDAGIFYTKKPIPYNFEDSSSILEPLPENLSPDEEHVEIQKRAKAAAAMAQPTDPKQQESDIKLVTKSQSYVSHHRQNYTHHYNHEEHLYPRHEIPREIPREIQFAVLNR